MAQEFTTRDGTEMFLQILEVPAASASIYLVVSRQKRGQDESTSIFVAPENDVKAMLRREQAQARQTLSSPVACASKAVSQRGNSIPPRHRRDDLATTSLSAGTDTSSSSFASSSSSSSSSSSGSSTCFEAPEPTNASGKRKHDSSDCDSPVRRKKRRDEKQISEASAAMLALAGEQRRHSDAVAARPKISQDSDLLQPRRHSSPDEKPRSAADDENPKKPPVFDGIVVGDIPCERNPTVYEQPWEAHFERLRAYVDEFGDCLVPLSSKTHPVLAQWVKRQRHQYKLRMRGDRSTMTDYRIQKLNSVGFVWQAQAASWYERYRDLKEFHGKFGHCKVPTRYPPNKALGAWVKCQRTQYRKRERGEHTNMSQERVAKLNELNFSWEGR